MAYRASPDGTLDLTQLEDDGPVFGTAIHVGANALHNLLTGTIGIPAAASHEYVAALCLDGFDSPLAFEEVTNVVC
jgi:hypothetical protein|eukprot:COSAG01_NODE_11469_length_1928_cov_1.777474_5_plen_76_part_00